MAKVKRIATVSDQLRAIISESGESQYRICKEAGVDPSQLWRFMQGRSCLTDRTIDKLGAYLQIKLTSVRAENE